MITGFTALFFNISGGEIFIILLIVFIVFGPSKIPEVARSLGRMMNEVKKASSDISREFRKETTAIERDLNKTARKISNDPGSLSENPIDGSEKKVPEAEETEIPDVYLKNDTQENEPGRPENDEEEKTEKPIQ